MLKRKFYNKSRAEWVAVVRIDKKEVVLRAFSESELDQKVQEVLNAAETR